MSKNSVANGEHTPRDEKRKRPESGNAGEEQLKKKKKNEKFAPKDSDGGEQHAPRHDSDKKEKLGKKFGSDAKKHGKGGKNFGQKGNKFGNKPMKHGAQGAKDATSAPPEFEETVCLCCRKRGHTMAHCPNNPNKPIRKSDLICFRCGEKGHGIKTCTKPKADGLTFATCFICKEKGHISRDCPQNTRGIYPKGGSCKICGDVWHLAKDCPEKGTAKDKKANADSGAPKVIDEDLEGNAEYDRPKSRVPVEDGSVDAKKKKAKVVKF